MRNTRLCSFRRAAALSFGTSLFVSACIAAHSPRAAEGGAPDVARLYGYVAEVDGIEPPSTGEGIPLTPGCHIVRTPSEWGGVGTDTALIVKTGRAVFHIDAIAGYRYEVLVGTSAPNELHMRGSLVAVEKDASGKVTRTFPPLRSAGRSA